MRSCFESNLYSTMPLVTESDGGVVRVSVVSDLGQANISILIGRYLDKARAGGFISPPEARDG